MSYRDKVVGQGGRDDSGKVIGQPMPCAFCGAITAHETLCMLGARCVACYRNYCAEKTSAPNVGSRSKDHKSWAYALRTREMSGERLTPPQRSMWRDAIRSSPIEEEA